VFGDRIEPTWFARAKQQAVLNTPRIVSGQEVREGALAAPL
jgi:hypothetical protein